MKYLTLYLALLPPMAFAQRWRVQYFYDQDRNGLFIEDLVFPTAQRGIAVGTIYDELAANKKPKFTVLVTSDGGEHWTLEPFKEHPRSLFFLNDSIGWLVTDNAIWFTEESGRSWKKIGEQVKPDKKLAPVPAGGLILRVWFLDAQHGFAVGEQKTVLETHNGGATWTPVEEAAKPTANPAHTAYSRIWFDGKVGIIVGGSIPPRSDDPNFPAWMEPERAVKRRQIPTLTLMLTTLDGGEKWKSSTAPLFGAVTSLRLAAPYGLLTFAFNDSFDWPSEVFSLDSRTGKNTRVFREKNRRVTDCAVFAGPRAYLAAVEPPGRLNSTPIPGKVKILTSTDLNLWIDMEVDYKAVARALILAGPDADHLWAATDTGMILHLTPTPPKTVEIKRP
jgi:photosystem II stability/assembly factor-like uncharacterized protein